MKIKDKNSNVSCIKLLAALMVILCHSYPLTGNGVDFLSRLTNGKTGLGIVAVAVFFSFSGFYLSRSLERNDDAILFVRRRMIKIFPPLMIVVLVSILIIGPVFTTLSLKEYFVDKRTYLYLINMLLIPIHELPGVFGEAPYNPTVNGSLWTLPVEFGCYIFLIILYKVKRIFGRKYINIILGALIFIVCPYVGDILRQTPIAILASAITPFSMFCMGHLYWEISERIIINKYILFLEVVILVLGLFTNWYTILFISVFPLFLITVTNVNRTWMKKGIWENISYEVYLWGWPIGQIIVELYPDISVAMHFALNVIIVVFIAIMIKKMEGTINGN